MVVDRYTKLVLTVIAVCLVWLSIGGPSLLTPVSAQQGGLGDRVILAGWVDEKGNVLSFPAPSPIYETDSFGRPTNRTSPRAQYPLPTTEWYK
jgi:hypothetical protein